MTKSNFSLVLGLTTTAVLSVSLPSEAFDFSTAQYIKVRPLESNTFLSFFGDNSTNEGFSVYYNIDTEAPDGGHPEISLTAPPNGIAPYYASGRNYSPEEPPSGSTRAASLIGSTNLLNFSNYLTNNNIALDRIGFSFGPKDGDFTKTWNLGEDEQNQDWFASPTTTLEERIYRANPDEVEWYFSYNNTKFITFSYSDVYSFLEYGPTQDVSDDLEALLTNPLKPTKVAGLDLLTSGLADALLGDINNAGGWLQLLSEDEAVVPDTFSQGNGYNVATLRFPVQLRVVSVPEPSTIVALVTLGLIGVSRRPKNKQSKP